MTGKDAGVVLHRALLASTLVMAALAGEHGSALAQSPASRTPAASRPASTTTGAARIQQLTVMAVVNGQQITHQQLAQECLARYGSEVLESMLNKHFIWQECQRQKIAITEADVEAEISRMAGKFGLPVDRWLAMLENEREIPPDKYRRDIIWPTLALRRLAGEQIVVTPDEIRRQVESEYGPKVKVRMLAVSTREKADELRAKALAEPSKFGDLAKEHSEDANSAAARGLIPPIRMHLGQADLEAAAFALKEGEISQVIQVANQFLLLKCEGRVAEQYLSSQHVKQVEEQIHDQIRDQKLRTAAGELFQRLQQTAQVVNVFNQPPLQQQMPGIAAQINGQQITMQQLGEECLLRHGKDVLEGEINRLLLTQELSRQGKAVEPAAVNDEIARAADAYGYLRPDGTPDVQAWLQSVTETEHVTVDLYVRDAVWPSAALKKLVNEQVQVSQEDLKKGFEANYGERVEVLAIVLGNQRVANTVWEQARANPQDQFFGELANQYSVEPVSKANFGKIPPIRRHGGQPVIEEEAFRLQPGELSGIISVADKYLILRCLGRTQPVVRDFTAVESELRRDLLEKKMRLAMADEFDRLKEAAQIDNFLTGTSQPGKRSMPASLPNGGTPAGTRR